MTAALARIESRAAGDGAPELFVDGQPAEHGVSLTDRAGCAACLVADEPAAIGCDLELVEPRSDAFVRDYLTGPEADLVAAAGPARDVAANLIWSAKESALKVLRTGLRRDTRSVEVTRGGPDAAGAMPGPRSRSGPPRAPFSAAGGGGAGRSCSPTCATRTFPRPAPLEAVSPLDEALPSDHWLHRPLT